jgi:hypothetical protein
MAEKQENNKEEKGKGKAFVSEDRKKMGDFYTFKVDEPKL